MEELIKEFRKLVMALEQASIGNPTPPSFRRRVKRGLEVERPDLEIWIAKMQQALTVDPDVPGFPEAESSQSTGTIPQEYAALRWKLAIRHHEARVVDLLLQMNQHPEYVLKKLRQGRWRGWQSLSEEERGCLMSRLRDCKTVRDATSLLDQELAPKNV